MWTKTSHLFTLDTVSTLPIHLEKWARVFLRGDLGAGKTTLTKHLLQGLLASDIAVKSPTYVYYNVYTSDTANKIYHFDLYRLHSYDDFVNIGGEEILDNPNNICLIEWPEVIEEHYQATLDLRLEKTGDEDVRRIEITQ